MSAKLVIVDIIAVLAGAIIGTLVAGLFAWLFAGTGFATALFSPRDYLLALVTVTLFAVFYAKIEATPAALASLAVGILLPTIIDRFAFGSPLSWGMILFLNFVFALAALSTYRFVHANGAVRDVARQATDR